MKEYANYYAGIKREDKVPVRQGRKPATVPRRAIWRHA